MYGTVWRNRQTHSQIFYYASLNNWWEKGTKIQRRSRRYAQHEQLDPAVMYRAFQSLVVECTIFSNAYGIFTK